ncbi:MAG: glycosyltransferase family 39 protein [Victivallales bacterium]|nr:glycosyltransferase family 39 protein [Victivallales bacterium]
MSMVNKFKELIPTISPRRYFILAALFAFAVFFIGLGSRHLGGGDEPRVAGIAAETYINGNWIEPKLNNKPFLEKPPLYFWADALSMQLFGRTDFAAKLPSAIAAFLGVLSLFALARGLSMSSFGAFLSVVFLSTAAQYWIYGRKCMIDIFLAVFIAFAMWAFWELCQSKKAKNTSLWFIFFILTLGGAIFSKGLIGLALPCSGLFFYLAIDDFYIEKKFNLKRWIYLFSGAALSFIPIALWIWALYEKSGYDAVHTVVWTNNFGRFTGSHAEHVESFWYYAPKLFEQLQPWTILLPFALWFNIRKVWKEKDNKALFMLCWLIIPYLLLMVSAGKRQVYVLPLYAAEVLLIANMLDQIYRNKFKLPAKLDYVNLITKILFIVFSIALFLGALKFIIIAVLSKMHWTLYIAPVIMLLCRAWISDATRRKQVGKICLALLIGLAATYISIDTIGRSYKNAEKSYYNMFKYCEQEIKTGKVLYLYQPIERESGAALFYLGRNCPHFDFKTMQAQKNMIILLDKRHSERFLKIDFKKDKEFKLKRRVYWVMKKFELQ